MKVDDDSMIGQSWKHCMYFVSRCAATSLPQDFPTLYFLQIISLDNHSCQPSGLSFHSSKAPVISSISFCVAPALIKWSRNALPSADRYLQPRTRCSLLSLSLTASPLTVPRTVLSPVKPASRAQIWGILVPVSKSSSELSALLAARNARCIHPMEPSRTGLEGCHSVVKDSRIAMRPPSGLARRLISFKEATGSDTCTSTWWQNTISKLPSAKSESPSMMLPWRKSTLLMCFASSLAFSRTDGLESVPMTWPWGHCAARPHVMDPGPQPTSRMYESGLR